MKRKSRWSSTVVGRRISVQRVAPVTAVRVKIIGEAAESRTASVAERKRSFAKTQAFGGPLPRFDDGLPSLAHDVTRISDALAPTQECEVPPAARPDEPVAQADRAAQDDSNTLRVRAMKPNRAQQLWQRQTPLFAFFVAVSLCVLSVLAVNWLAP